MASRQYVTLDRADLLHYAARGYHIERSLFSADEAAERSAHYMEINRQGPHPGDFVGVPRRTGTGPEPLLAYPRLIQMHEWDSLSEKWMNDPRIVRLVTDIMGQEPCVLQTMVYFKPPGSRGQSFHQDNLYLRATPIVAAWMALDHCDGDNGAMEMLAGSHLLGLLPCRVADTDKSFTDSETVFPAYLHKQLIELDLGDVVFLWRPDGPWIGAERNKRQIQTRLHRPLSWFRAVPDCWAAPSVLGGEVAIRSHVSPLSMDERYNTGGLKLANSLSVTGGFTEPSATIFDSFSSFPSTSDGMSCLVYFISERLIPPSFIENM